MLSPFLLQEHFWAKESRSSTIKRSKRSVFALLLPTVSQESIYANATIASRKTIISNGQCFEQASYLRVKDFYHLLSTELPSLTRPVHISIMRDVDLPWQVNLSFYCGPCQCRFSWPLGLSSWLMCTNQSRCTRPLPNKRDFIVSLYNIHEHVSTCRFFVSETLASM